MYRARLPPPHVTLHSDQGTPSNGSESTILTQPCKQISFTAFDMAAKILVRSDLVNHTETTVTVQTYLEILTYAS